MAEHIPHCMIYTIEHPDFPRVIYLQSLGYEPSPADKNKPIQAASQIVFEIAHRLNFVRFEGQASMDGHSFQGSVRHFHKLLPGTVTVSRRLATDQERFRYHPRIGSFIEPKNVYG